MSFTASDVKDLREKTGCGMMDCKKALTETDGNMDKAMEYLREKGLAAAAKKASRIAAEGIVTCYVDGRAGTILEVNSETDFVAKNADFVGFVNSVAVTITKNNPADVETLSNLTLDGSSITVAEALREKILTIGENMNIRRFIRIEGDVVSYIHGGGRIGVLIDFDTDVANKAEFTEMAKNICMQVAALNPAYLDKASVPAEVVENEKSVLIAQIKNDDKNKNKPDAIIEKMVGGRINKYYEQNCLLEQEYVKDNAITVQKFIENTAKELGGKISIKSFVRFEKGEGLQKREDDFASEVANMAK